MDEAENKDSIPTQYIAMVMNCAMTILADEFGWEVAADPTGSMSGEPGIVLQIGSLRYPDVSISAVFKPEESAMKNCRKAIINFAFRLYVLEEEKERETKSKLIVPEKTLYVPK